MYKHQIQRVSAILVTLLTTALMCFALLPQSALAAQSTAPADGSKLSPEQQMASNDLKVRARGIQTIVVKRITKALPQLETMAKTDESAGIRRLACWAIGELKLKGGMLTLRTVARNDSSDSVKTAAQRALEKLGAEIAETDSGTDTPKATPTQVFGSCLKDTDCKGDRICEDGNCKTLTRKPTMGWATEAAVIGFLGAGAVGGLSVYAAQHPEDLLPAIPLAAGATLVTVIVAPAVKSGSLSLRDGNGVPGSLAFRVIGWTAFGVHIVGSAALAAAIPLHWLKRDDEGGNWTPQSSWITANSIAGMTSLLCLTIDVLVARGQSKRLIEVPETIKPKSTAPDLAVIPFLAPVLSENGASGATMGLTGRF